MKLEDVKWSYGGEAEGFRATTVPGVLVSEDAFPPRRPIPGRLLRAGREIQEQMLEEFEEDVRQEALQLDAMCFSGKVQWWKGEEWWEFSTLSSYSVTLWVGKLDGELTTTERLGE